MTGFRALVRRERCKRGGGERPLQRDQRDVVERREAEARPADAGEERVVDGFSGGVDHQPERAVRGGSARHHEIVDDAALVVEELRVALPARSQTEDVGCAEGLEERRHGPVVRPFDRRLAHVRDIEKPCGLAGVQMLAEDPGRILDRHVIAREGGHAGAELDVQRVQGRLTDGVVAHGSTDRVRTPRGARRNGSGGRPA